MNSHVHFQEYHVPVIEIDTEHRNILDLDMKHPYYK